MQELIEFYTHLWGDSSLYRSIWYGKKGMPPNKSKWFTNTQEAVEFAHSLNMTKQFNVYHACSLFNKESRKQQDVGLIKALWLDLDLKRTTCSSIKELGTTYLPTLAQFFLGSNYWVINTGNGFHVYWILTTPIDVDHWSATSKELVAFCKQSNIPHERVTDTASLMRVPQSWNLKDDIPKQVKIILIGSPVDCPVPIKPKLNSDVVFTDDDYENLNIDTTQYSDSDANKVADNCALIGQFRKDGLDDSEPLWHFALGVVHNCVNGDELAHAFSAKSPRYNEKETTDKLAAITSNDIKPCLCETFESHGCVYCKDCKHRGKISTPIQLGTIDKPIDDDLDDIKNDELVKRAQKLINLAPAGKWEVNKGGIYCTVDDERVVVSSIPFYVIDKFCDDTNDATIMTALIRAYTKIGIITFKIPLKTIAEERKLMGEFNARGIFPYDKKLFVWYITSYLHKIAHIKPRIAVNSLGWQIDDSFVFSVNGDTYDKKGDYVKSIIETKALGFLEGITAKGSLKKWASVVDIYNKDKIFYPHLLSLLCSLGAPLLSMTGVTGFVLSLQGLTSGGKTLSHSYAISAWGNPAEMRCLGTKDTNTSMLARLAAYKNLPLRIDEATMLSDKRLSGLIYELVNGRGRARCTIDGSLSNTSYAWKTITLITTNRPLLEFGTTTLTDAERCRLLELFVAVPSNMIDIGKQIGDVMENNYGLAGKEFIKWVICNKKRTQVIMNHFFDHFREFVDDSKRFWISCGAIAFTAAMIAEEMGLFKIDIASFSKWFSGILRSQVTLNSDLLIEARGFETKEELIHALRDHLGGHVLVVNNDGNTITEPSREIKAILQRMDHEKDKFYVRSPILNDFIRLNFTSGLKTVKNDFGIGDSKLTRIGSRTGRFYIFEL